MTRRISRRQALAGAGTISLGALLAACGGDEDSGGDSRPAGPGTQAEANTSPRTGARFDDAPSCRLTPEQTEGPFYFDAGSVRSDIRDDREGAPLLLGVRVRNAERCDSLPDAVVDVWHCDALGEYSQSGDPFLRGTQVTDREGVVEFRTVYPGWYMGRTVHIHAKVHLDRTAVLTTQLYFDDDFTAKVHEREPYASRRGRDASNASDGIFNESLLLKLSEEGGGYAGLINLDVESA
jgi:protocatechuate 3,4-dioxygenase beta subunit